MTHTILIVDDAPSMRLLLRDTLEPLGYTVVEACNGVEASARLDGTAFDAIVCDVSMPSMDGIAFLRSVRANPRYARSPVVVLTGDSRESTRDAAKAAGAQAYCIKPFLPRDLRATIGKLCDGVPA
jgi:two-component system chemotaxis response regulator CheY